MYYRYRDQDIYYEISGHGETLVILHGWGVSSNSFQNIIPELSKQYKVIAIDLLGFGLSDAPLAPLSLDDYVDSLYALLNHLRITQPTILGHSFGGRIAIRYGTKYPVSSLILVCSAGIKHRSLKTQWKILKYKLKKYYLKVFNKAKLNDLFASSGSKDYRKASPVMKMTMNRIIKIDLKKDISRLDIKVLLLWGFHDQATPLADALYMNKQLKDSRLVIFYHSGHFPYLDEPEKFVKVIMKGGV